VNAANSENFARVGKLDVRYALTGDGDAPVVTFVHGLVASLEHWAPAAEALCASGFRVLRYDLRAHGSTTALREPCSRHDLAADLVGLWDALGIVRSAVVGHSAGGVIAQQAALDFPDRVSALGLVGTSSACNDKAAAWYSQCIEVARDQGGGALMELMGASPGKAAVPDGLGIVPVIEAMRSLNTDPLTEPLRALQVPTLIIVGDKDFLGVGGSVILSRAIAGAELEIVPERGHGIYEEAPDWFAARLATFLTKHLR